MDKQRATETYEAFRKRNPHPRGATWQSYVQFPNGTWLFTEANADEIFEGVAVTPDGEAFSVQGALGKVMDRSKLGAPLAAERFLGSTAYGRYQPFERGLGIWEGYEDIGYPLIESVRPLRRQLCVVAFFDLRGFTSWSHSARPEETHQAVEALEAAIHEGFPVESPPCGEHLFLKGTGDGAMIVSQADWFGAPLHIEATSLSRGHAAQFLVACERIVVAGRRRLDHYRFPLAIGCGIAAGELDRVFRSGRLDFIGRAANEAAKLQQHAWNEVCVTREFGEALVADGRSLDQAKELASKGWRLRAP